MSYCAEDSANTELQIHGRMQRRERGLLTREDRCEIRDRIAQWLFTPQPLRTPSTFKQLAQDLHISYSFARYLKDKIPNDLQDYIAQCHAIALAQYGAIVRTLVERAKAGDADAAKLIFRAIILPLKSGAGVPKKGQPLESVKRAFEMLGVVRKARAKGKAEAENQQVRGRKAPAPNVGD